MVKLDGREPRSMTTVALKGTGRLGIYDVLQMYTFDSNEESVSLRVIP